MGSLTLPTGGLVYVDANAKGSTIVQWHCQGGSNGGR